MLLAAAVRRGRIGRREAVRSGAAFAACVLALGGYWYARNWIATGNPVHPFDVRVAGVHVFEGPVRIGDALTRPSAEPEPWPLSVARSWAADLRFWQQGTYEYEQRSGGLGPVWPWLGLPLLALLAFVLARRRSPAALALIVSALVFLVQPYRWWSRFTLQFAALGAIAVVAAALWAPRAWLRGAIRAAALALALVGVASTVRAVDPAARAPALGAGELLRLAGDPGERTLGRLFYPEYRFLDDMPADATVAVDLLAPQLRFVYPLFGASYGRRVIAADAEPPDGAWLITGSGRPLDREASRDPQLTLAADVRGVRVYRPRATPAAPS